MIPKKICTLIVIFLTGFTTFSQEKFTLSGIISDTNSNETLIGVTILIPELKSGVTTNEYGFYSLTVPKGDYTLRIEYLGYETILENISLIQNIKKITNFPELKMFYRRSLLIPMTLKPIIKNQK